MFQMSTNLHELESTSQPFSVKCALFSNKTFCGSLDSTGINKGSCLRINHFPEDNNYDTDSSEYILRKCLSPTTTS